jgi:excisionase family DNA binding protein
MKQNFRTSEVGKFFDVTRATVFNWITRGKLPAYETLGGHYRVMREDLVDFIKNRKIPLPNELQSDKYKILIVDDNESVIEAIEIVLKSMGISLDIETAHNGIEAGIKLARFVPEIVILDVIMPGADGSVVCNMIKQDRLLKDTRILVFTGYPREGRKLLELGADKIIEKASFNCLDILQKEVRRLLGIKYKKVLVKSL